MATRETREVNRRSEQEAHLKYHYNLTIDDYNLWAEIQDHTCAICEEFEEKKRADGTEMPLSVDHCHETGRIRGLLCHRCNTGLGLFRDDTKLLKKAVEYLGESPQEVESESDSKNPD